MSMITATAWVPRGYPTRYPAKYTINEEEISRIAELTQSKLDEAKHDLQDARQPPENAGDDSEQSDGGAAVDSAELSKVEDDLREYNLDKYDDDGDGTSESSKTLNIFGNIKSLAYHNVDEEDPYITMPQGEADEDEEREELEVLPTDNMIVAARVEDEVAHLEVYIYEDDVDNLYVHHDIMLPAIPLCVAWLDTGGASPQGQSSAASESRNFVAVGTFDPDIELWNLDTVDCLYPTSILGPGGEAGTTQGEAGAKRKKKMRKKKNDQYHVDAVLALAANPNHRTLLASASADQTVKLWDLNTSQCAHSYAHHTDKVCALDWHPTETAVLLSGSYDRSVIVGDMRAPAQEVPRWRVDSDVETVRWNGHDSRYFYVTTEGGLLYCFDQRQIPSAKTDSKPAWRLQAHDESISSFSVNPHIPGYLATGSTDKTVKLWNVTGSGQPALVTSRQLGVGKVFGTSFAPDAEVAFRLAVAGSKGALQIWDTSTNPAVRHAFATRLKDESNGPPPKERTVGIADEADESSDESEDEEAEGDGNRADEWMNED